MGWYPPKSEAQQPWLSPRARTLISRRTLMLVGLVLVYVGYRFIDVAIRAASEAAQTMSAVGGSRRRASVPGLVLVLGGTACLLGLVTVAAAFMPVAWMERFRPKPPVTGDRGLGPERDWWRHW